MPTPNLRKKIYFLPNEILDIWFCGHRHTIHPACLGPECCDGEICWVAKGTSLDNLNSKNKSVWKLKTNGLKMMPNKYNKLKNPTIFNRDLIPIKDCNLILTQGEHFGGVISDEDYAKLFNPIIHSRP